MKALRTMQGDNDQKVAIVTGAANGIGYTCALELGKAGHSVAIVDLDDSAAEAAAEQVAEATGAKTCWCGADVTDQNECELAYKKILKALGPPSVLVNNAGVLVRRKGRLEDLTTVEIDKVMAVHVGGTLNWSRLVIPAMRRAGFGRIINLSSCNAILAVPYRIAYVTAKKAIRGLTEALALETARAGITVNAIAPGYILTDVLRQRSDAGILDQDAIAERTPVGRWGEPEEIAKAIAFLVSEDASFITGTTLVIDGGLTIRGDAGEDLETAH